MDSSGWIEYFADGPNASFFEEAIADAGSLVVPVISLYEVFKRLLREPEGEPRAGSSRRDATWHCGGPGRGIGFGSGAAVARDEVADGR